MRKKQKFPSIFQWAFDLESCYREMGGKMHRPGLFFNYQYSRKTWLRNLNAMAIAGIL